MADQHKVHLLVSATVTLFREILQELDVADRGVCNAGFQIFAEFVINDKGSVITVRTKLIGDFLIKFYHIKAEERIKNAPGGKRGI
ncbi:hypothetical protein SDC9_59803 [bioreactor metagenome]|uniref:Uncharacterized protein n=1 Tax=bioreactor metagenome TaxID=1076179 RepID=A0A644XB50_9ZZZZ